MMRTLRRRDALALLAAAGVLPGTWAQGPWPERPLKVVVPQPPGGGFDFVARTLAERLSRQLGQPVVVENKAGSGTVVGTDYAAKAAPDGYTLLTGSISNLALNPGMYRNLPYDSLRDFEPLGLAVAYGYTLMARKDLPQKSLKDVVAYARANPGRLNYASAGNGSGQHVIAAALWQAAGVDIAHVPYRGAQAAYQDLVGGRVDLFFDLASTARVQVDAGTVVPLAVSSAARNPQMPQVPTIGETGVAKLELESWFGLFASPKIPAAARERLRRELAQVIAMPEVEQAFAKAGGRPLKLSPQQAQELVKRDVEHWSALVARLAIKPE